MDELIKYLEESLTLDTNDLILGNDDRVALHAKRELLEEIKELRDKGVPTND